MTTGALFPSAASAARPDTVQSSLNALVADDRMPAALASVVDREGRMRNYTAGVGDLKTGAKVPKDGQVRAGSNTKAFTAVVALQLVAEKKIALDAPVETYLPGLLRGEGIDGHHITVRQLLQHTSGLPEYMESPVFADFPTATRTTWSRALLPPAQLTQMRTTVPAEARGPGVRYGLGLTSTPLSCGGVCWGHGGTALGYRTRGGVTEDGRAADIVVTTAPTGAASQRVEAAVDTALCR
ncbi:serine hydrolase domain-containing protein [Streptomyces sp. NPDC056230]|uniref:serine hydrolase domain-containing protein n=1 Tax=Streptomyces sp. NPDC056230 TaxID=3345754 RepID=UPI0035D97344